MLVWNYDLQTEWPTYCSDTGATSEAKNISTQMKILTNQLSNSSNVRKSRLTRGISSNQNTFIKTYFISIIERKWILTIPRCCVNAVRDFSFNSHKQIAPMMIYMTCCHCVLPNWYGDCRLHKWYDKMWNEMVIMCYSPNEQPVWDAFAQTIVECRILIQKTGDMCYNLLLF